MKISRSFLLILTLLVSVTLFADTNMRVYGYVFNGDREPAEYVTIQVLGGSVGTVSRSDGYYLLEFSIADTATIKFSFVGFEPYYYKVSTKQQRVQKMVYLNESSVSLKAAEISAYRDQLTSSDQLDLSKLQNMPDVSGGGIESIISTYAGVSAGNELSSQYSVRGGSYDENSVYVNDIEIYRPLLIRSGQQEGLSFINPELVSSVSFSAGGFESKYGDKMASVLDIKYKKPKKFEASISGSLLGASAYVGQISKNKKFTQIHGVRYKSTNYVLGSLAAKGIYDQRFFDYQTYMTYDFTSKWEFSVLGNFSQNSYNYIPDSLSQSYTLPSEDGVPTTNNLRVYFDGQEKDLFQTFFGAATLKYKPNKKLLLSILGSAFNTEEEISYDIAGAYWLGEVAGDDNTINTESTVGVGSYLDFARNKLRATVKNLSHKGKYFAKKNELEWGLSFQQELINDKIDEFQIRDSAGYSLPYNPDIISLYYNLNDESELSTYRYQAHLQDAFKFGHFSFVGGVRASYWTFNKEFLISPRMTIAYQPDWKQDFVFRFATGVYYQSPFYKEIRDTIVDNQRNVTVHLNNDIKAQRSLHFVLGSDYRFHWVERPFKFSAEVYYKPADRVTTYTVDNVKIVYSGENDAVAYTAGIDLKLFGEFVPGTDSWVNLSIMQSKEDRLEDEYGYISRPNEQRYVFSTFFQDFFPGFPKYKVHLKFIWADGLPYWAPNAEHKPKTTSRTRTYKRVDIGTTRSLVKGDFRWLDKTNVFHLVRNIKLGFEVFNLLDFENVESHYWVTDINSKQHAVPSTLTGRRFNIRVSLGF